MKKDTDIIPITHYIVLQITENYCAVPHILKQLFELYNEQVTNLTLILDGDLTEMELNMIWTNITNNFLVNNKGFYNYE
jgi:hypothetical protein